MYQQSPEKGYRERPLDRIAHSGAHIITRRPKISSSLAAPLLLLLGVLVAFVRSQEVHQEEQDPDGGGGGGSGGGGGQQADDEDPSHDGEHEEPAFAVLYPWFVQAVGILVFFLMTRTFHGLPYTAVMFLVGMVMGM